MRTDHLCARKLGEVIQNENKIIDLDTPEEIGILEEK